MRLALTDDQRALRDTVRDVLARECPPEVVRAAWPGGDAGPPDRLWSTLAGLGLPAAGVPESHGGLGLSEVDLSPVLTELGRAAVPLPVAETAAVAGPLLAAAGDPGGHLPALMAGRLRVAVAGPTGLVPYGRRADLVLHLDRAAAFLAPPGAAAADVTTVDGSRAAVRVAGGTGGAGATGSADGTTVTTDSGLLARTGHRLALATAAQLVGLGEELRDRTVGYVSVRHQFGVPVGSFQAVQHQLADLTLRLSLAAPAVLAGAWAAATGDPDRDRDVAVAALLATEAATLAARTAIWCHGAMGYTVENDLHLLAKRVWALAAADRGTDHHLERVATSLDLPEGATRE